MSNQDITEKILSSAVSLNQSKITAAELADGLNEYRAADKYDLNSFNHGLEVLEERILSNVIFQVTEIIQQRDFQLNTRSLGPSRATGLNPHLPIHEIIYRINEAYEIYKETFRGLNPFESFLNDFTDAVAKVKTKNFRFGKYAFIILANAPTYHLPIIRGVGLHDGVKVRHNTTQGYCRAIDTYVFYVIMEKYATTMNVFDSDITMPLLRKRSAELICDNFEGIDTNEIAAEISEQIDKELIEMKKELVK
jgi:hypothetical protein